MYQVPERFKNCCTDVQWAEFVRDMGNAFAVLQAAALLRLYAPWL